MQKHQLNIVPTIEATATGRLDAIGNTYVVAWPSSENCIGLPSDFNGYKQQLYNPNRM